MTSADVTPATSAPVLVADRPEPLLEMQDAIMTTEELLAARRARRAEILAKYNQQQAALAAEPVPSTPGGDVPPTPASPPTRAPSVAVLMLTDARERSVSTAPRK